jgi:hypothetical protein
MGAVHCILEDCFRRSNDVLVCRFHVPVIPDQKTRAHYGQDVVMKMIFLPMQSHRQS